MLQRWNGSSHDHEAILQLHGVCGSIPSLVGVIRGLSYLAGQSVGSEVTQRKLESSVAAFDVDLEGHQSIWVRS